VRLAIFSLKKEINLILDRIYRIKNIQKSDTSSKAGGLPFAVPSIPSHQWRGNSFRISSPLVGEGKGEG